MKNIFNGEHKLLFNLVESFPSQALDLKNEENSRKSRLKIREIFHVIFN
jgi:hypothetical protein